MIFIIVFLASVCFLTPYIKNPISPQKAKTNEDFNLDVSIYSTFGTSKVDEVIDISVSQKPEWISYKDMGSELLWKYFHTKESSGANSVYCDGYFAYVAYSGTGVDVYNVTEKDQISFVTNFNDPGFLITHVIKGDRKDRLFLLSEKAFYIIDVSNKLQIKLIYKLEFSKGPVVITDDTCKGIDHNDGYVLLTCTGVQFDACFSGAQIGIVIIDVSNPDQSKSAPKSCVKIDAESCQQPFGVKFHKTGFPEAQTYGVLTCNDQLDRHFAIFLAVQDEIGIYDYYNQRMADTWFIEITSDDYIYMTTFFNEDHQHGFDLFLAEFVLDTKNLQILEYTYKLENGGKIFSIFLHDDRYLYVGSQSDQNEVNVNILDLKVREKPVDLGNICTVPECTNNGDPTSISVIGNYVYISIHNSIPHTTTRNDNSISFIVLGLGGLVIKGDVPGDSGCQEFDVSLEAIDDSSSVGRINNGEPIYESFKIEVEEDCNHHGSCDFTKHKCVCIGKFTGDGCKNCIDDHYFGTECNITTCKGILSNETRAVI